MTRTYKLADHKVISFTQSPSPKNPWLLWDIITGTLGLICFGGLLTALYIIA